MDPDLQSKGPRPAGVLDRSTLVVIMRLRLKWLFFGEGIFSFRKAE